MGRRNGESGERISGADSFCRGGGGGGGARSDFRRKKTAELTNRVGPPISEGKASGRLGWKGREEVGRGWAGKGGRRWATAGLEKEGGGGPRLGWKRREEARPNPLLGLKSKIVKEKQF
jgi:hypothetical protein